MNEHNNSHGRLFRSRNDRIIAGVCGGIAEFYNISSISVRIVFILLTLLNGIGLILYLIGVFLIPDNYDEFIENNRKKTTNNFISKIQKEAQNIAAHIRVKSAPGDNKDIFKTILIVLVTIVLLQMLLPSFLIWISFDLILIIAVILIAAYLIRK